MRRVTFSCDPTCRMVESIQSFQKLDSFFKVASTDIRFHALIGIEIVSIGNCE